METTAAFDKEVIKDACQRYGVRRLQVFGSVLSERFDPQGSDADFLVEFLPGRDNLFDDYFGLREALAAIVGRLVDLVVSRAVRNPYFKAAALNSAHEIYVVDEAIIGVKRRQVM